MAAEPNELAQSDEHLAGTIALREHSDRAGRLAGEAFIKLYDRHAAKLLAFLAARVNRNDREDMHQEVWRRVWEFLPVQFSGGSFRAWLYQIARNYMLDQVRKKRPELIGEQDDLAGRPSEEPQEMLIAREREVVMRRCLQELDKDTESVVRARLAGEAYPEICQRLGLAPEKAYKLFHQAKARLQSCLEGARQ